MYFKFCYRLLFSSCFLIYSTISFGPRVFLDKGSRLLIRSSTVDNVSDVDLRSRIESLKTDLINLCDENDSANKFEISNLVRELEELGKENNNQLPLLSGEWRLIYASEDITRSSPFFWAFRNAFPSSSNEIFSITDAIPPPIKEVGPATQVISLNEENGTGTLVSRVKVATLAGFATSIMTTRCSIASIVSSDTIRLIVDTTKPEDSTILKSLGPLGNFINENSLPFPSGRALEQAKKGSSEVLLQNTFCDETMRIACNKEGLGDVYVWIREGFISDYDV